MVSVIHDAPASAPPAGVAPPSPPQHHDIPDFSVDWEDIERRILDLWAICLKIDNSVIAFTECVLSVLIAYFEGRVPEKWLFRAMRYRMPLCSRLLREMGATDQTVTDFEQLFMKETIPPVQLH